MTSSYGKNPCMNPIIWSPLMLISLKIAFCQVARFYRYLPASMCLPTTYAEMKFKVEGAENRKYCRCIMCVL